MAVYYQDQNVVIEDVTASGHWVPPNVPNWTVLCIAACVTLLGILGVLAIDPFPLAAATGIFLLAALAMLPSRLSVTADSVRLTRHPFDRPYPLRAIAGFAFSRPRLAPYDEYFVLVEGDPRPRFLFNSGTPGYEQILLHLLERTGLHQFDEIPRPSPRAWIVLGLMCLAALGVLVGGALWIAKLLAHTPAVK